MNSPDPSDRRIIVDEDWKSKVEREREASQHPQGDRRPAPEAADESGLGADELPPASFSLLVTTLATQAMVHLGQFPDPVDEQLHVELPLAQHYIDTLAVLEEKTRNNLTPDEDHMLQQVLHQLRVAFIHVQKSAS